MMQPIAALPVVLRCRHEPAHREETVRHATAAFNAGRRDEARKVCEQGLSRAPRDPMLSHLLAARAVFAREIVPRAAMS